MRMNLPASASTPVPRQVIDRERGALLRQLERALEVPMVVLGFAWLALLIVELTAGLSRALEVAGTVIWMLFIADFALKFSIAPRKLRFLRQQWLTALSLALPALRILRIVRLARVLRVARAARGLRLLRIVSSLNRGLRALRASMGRRGLGYMLALTAVVTVAGAAGMFAFENGDPGLRTFGDALWWTAMMMTTVGSDYFPRTAEGRALCFLLAAFAFAVWGYLTATLATFFVGRDAENEKAEVAGAKSIERLHEELRALREAVQTLAENQARR